MVSVFFARVQTCGIYSVNMLERAMESSEEWLENVLRELDLCHQKLLQELSMCGITPKQIVERKEQGEDIDDASVEPFHKVLEELTNCRERISESLKNPVSVRGYVGECDMGVQHQSPTNISDRQETGYADCEPTCEIFKPSVREINLSDINLADMDNLKEMNSSNNEEEEEEGEEVERDEDLPDFVKHVLAELASCREKIKAALNLHADSSTEDEQLDRLYDVAVDGDCSVEKVWQEFKECRVKIRETLRNELEDRNVDLDGKER